MLRILARQTRLSFESGAEHLYSHSGYVLLSIVVQRATKRTLDDFARERIFTPLGMRHTRFQHDHAALIPGRANGYVQRGGAWRIANSPLDVVGDGGLYSTVDDMLRWAPAFERPEFAPLLSRMQTPGTLTDGRTIPSGYGMGLSRGMHRGVETVIHGGSLVGYRTGFMRVPSEQLTIIVLCNTATANAGRFAQLIVEAYAGDRFTTPPPAPANPSPAPPTPADAVTPDVGRALEGVYFSAELDATYRIAVDRSSVVIEVGSRPPVPLELVAPDRFRFPPVGAVLAPVRDASGRVTGLTLTAGRVRDIVFVRR